MGNPLLCETESISASEHGHTITAPRRTLSIPTALGTLAKQTIPLSPAAVQSGSWPSQCSRQRCPVQPNATRQANKATAHRPISPVWVSSIAPNSWQPLRCSHLATPTGPTHRMRRQLSVYAARWLERSLSQALCALQDAHPIQRRTETSWRRRVARGRRFTPRSLSHASPPAASAFGHHCMERRGLHRPPLTSRGSSTWFVAAFTRLPAPSAQRRRPR